MHPNSKSIESGSDKSQLPTVLSNQAFWTVTTPPNHGLFNQHRSRCAPQLSHIAGRHDSASPLEFNPGKILAHQVQHDPIFPLISEYSTTHSHQPGQLSPRLPILPASSLLKHPATRHSCRHRYRRYLGKPEMPRNLVYTKLTLATREEPSGGLKHTAKDGDVYCGDSLNQVVLLLFPDNGTIRGRL